MVRMADNGEGLFSCCKHPANAALAWCCFPCAHGEVYAAVEGEDKYCFSGKCILGTLVMFVPYLGCYCLSVTRNKVRQQSMVQGSSCLQQFLEIWCCACCVLAQMRTEYDNGHKDKEPKLMTF